MNPVYLALPESALQRGFRGCSSRLEEFGKLGDFAIGTLPKENGLFTLCEDQIWGSGNGHCTARPISRSEFLLDGAIVPFAAETEEEVKCLSGVNQFVTMIARMTPSPNYAYAVRIRGTFSTMQITSAPHYCPIHDIPDDRLFQLKNVKGALLGFFFPPLLEQVAWTGYRFHFLSADHAVTGRLVECEIEKPLVALHHLDECRIALPQTSDFQMTDF